MVWNILDRQAFKTLNKAAIHQLITDILTLKKEG